MSCMYGQPDTVELCTVRLTSNEENPTAYAHIVTCKGIEVLCIYRERGAWPVVA